MKKRKKKLQGGGSTPPLPFYLNEIIPSFNPNLEGYQIPSTPPSVVGPRDAKEMANQYFQTAALQQGDWMSSPMYKEMLYNSLKGMDNFTDEQITAFQNARLQNLNTMPKEVKFYHPRRRPGTGGYSMNNTGQVYQARSFDETGDEYMPLSFMKNRLYPHEISHSIDRPLDPSYKNRFLTAQLDSLGSNFQNLNPYQRLIPDSDIGLMRQSLISTQENRDQQPGHVPIEFWRDYGNTPEEGALRYFTDPTEVRARLNEIRMMGLDKGIYDPRREKMNEFNYDRMMGHPAKEALEAYFTKDGIIKMLNSISDATAVDTNKNVGMAATGGQVKKMQAGGPAPKNNELIDLDLIMQGKDTRFIDGSYDKEQNQTLFENLSPDIQQNFNYLTGQGEYANINPDEYNVPKDFLPENFDFGPLPMRSRNTGKGQFSSESVGENMAYDLARKGIVRNVNGEMVNMNDEEGVEWDEKTWYDKLIGVAGATENKLLRRTVDYMPLWKTKADEDAQKKDKEAYEQQAQDNAYGAKSIIPFHMLDKMFTGYKYAGYYPTYDEESGQYVLQETYLDEPEFQRVKGALLNPYGPASYAKSPLGAMVDNFSHTLGNLGPDLLNFAELTTDIAEASYNLAFGTGNFDSDPDGWTDRWAAQARTNSEFHDYAKSAMEQTDNLFANGTAFAGGLGSGIASLLSFWGMGGAAAKGTIKLAKFLTPANKVFNKKFASMVGHIGGGTPINAGEIYKQAKADGLDDDDAALMSLGVGFINSLVEYSLGSNYLANKAFGTAGSRSIYKSIFDTAKRANMKPNDIKFLDDMTGPIFKTIFNALEKVGADGPKLFQRGARGLSSGIEEGGEEIIQGAIVQGTKEGYNWIKQDDKDLAQGRGKFRQGRFDMEQLMNEGALGFILGGGTRTIMNTAYEPDLMSLIMDGKADDVYKAIDHIHAMGGFSAYQRNKIKKRVQVMEAYANENAPAWSRLDAKGQYVVGQALLHNENYKQKLNNLNKRRAKIQANDNLTDDQKEKKLDLLKAEELALNNLKDINNTMLEYFNDPNLAKKYNLQNIPSEVVGGLSELAFQKSRVQWQKQKIQEVYDGLNPKSKRKLNRLLNKLKQTKAGKDLADTIEIQKLIEEGRSQEAVDKLIAQLDKSIDSFDAKINELLTVPEKWGDIQKTVKEKMKTEKEKEDEENGPLTKKDGTEKGIDPDETMEEKRTRKKQEKLDKANIEQERKDRISRQVALEGTETVPPSHIKYGNKKNGEILEVREEGGKKVYILKQKDKKGNNIKVTEGPDVFPYLAPSLDENTSKHKANFLKTYWLQTADVETMGTLTKEEFQDLLNSPDQDLINNIQLEFVNVPREFNEDSAIKEKNMYINMNGSYIRVIDGRKEKGDPTRFLAVIKTSNRFYDLDKKLIPGDKMTLEFFNNNMEKNGKPFTEDTFAEFQRNYIILDKIYTKLEDMYPNATESSPGIIDNSMFSFNVVGKPNTLSDNITTRLAIDAMGSELTYNGEYILYDSFTNKVILGDKPSKDMMSRLPGENFEGRYFALVNYEGNVDAQWIRIFPTAVDPKEVENKIKTLKKDITRLNNFVKQGTDIDFKQEVKDINKKLDMFIAAKGGYTIKVHADLDLNSNTYKLSVHAQRVVEGEYENIEGLTNLRLPNNASLNTIINTINDNLSKYKGAPNITVNSFKKSIPDDGSEVVPSDFQSSLGPGRNFGNATMILNMSDDFFQMQKPPEVVDISPDDIIDPSDIIGLEEDTEQEQKESYSRKEAIERLKKKLKGKLENYDTEKNKLNNGVRVDLESQLFAQLKDGPEYVDSYFEDPTSVLETLFDMYVEGITVESFIPLNMKEVTDKQLEEIEEKADFSFRQKTILQSENFDKVALFNKVEEKYKYVEEEADILSENWDMDLTEIGLDGTPAVIKTFLSNITSPATDIFGRKTWQSDKYGTTEIRKALDGHFVMGNMMMLLSNQLNTGNIMVRLEAIAKYDPQVKLVLQAINEKPSVKPGFIEAMNRFELGYKKVLVNKNRATITDPVKSSPTHQTLDTWYSKSAGIDIKIKNRAINKITELINQEEDTSYKDVDKLIRAFNELGWRITPATAGYLLGDQVLRDAYPELMYNSMNSMKGFLGKLSSYIKKPNSISDKDALYKLATIEGLFSPYTYEPNYKDAEGKSKYKYIQRNYILDTTRKIKEGKLNDRFIELPNNLLKGKTSGIEVKMAGDLVIFGANANEVESAATNKTLTDKQRLLLSYSLFGDSEISDHAYYLPLVVADKKSLYAIRLPKKRYYENGVTQLAIDDVFNSLFVREFERNLNEETKQPGENYFFYLSMLNDFKIANPDGKMITVPQYLKDRKTLDGIEDDIKTKIIKPALEQQISKQKERIQQLQLQEEIGNLQVGVNPSIGDLDSKIGNTTLNHFIIGVNYQQLAFGDHAYKDDTDYNKRLAGGNATGTKKGSINYKYLMIADDILSPEDAFGVEESSANDAQAIITDKMAAVRELETNLIKTAKEKAIYEKLKRSLTDPDAYPTPQELNALDLNSTKTVGFDGIAFQPENGGRYFKKSDFILTKQFAEEQAEAGNPQLLNIYNKLNDNQIMYLYANSVSKLKSDSALSVDFFNTDQDINEDNIHTGSLEYELNQVVNETKSKYGIESYATQAKQLHDLIGSVSTTPESRAIADAIIEASTNSKNAYFGVITELQTNPILQPVLRAAILETVRGTRSANVIETLEKGNLNSPLISNIVRTSIVNMMNKDAVRSQVTGNAATLMSGTHVVNPQTGQPLAIHRDVNGNIEYAEILASRKMFGLERYKNIKDIPSDLLKAFGTRIPVQAHHSMIPLKVVGFLPDANGDTIVTPRELPALAGSDYDLDKLYIHRYATTINEEGKTVRIPSNLSPEDQMVFWGKNEYVKLTQEVLGQGLVEALHTLGIIQGDNEDGTIVLVPHPLVEQNNMLDNMFKLFNTPEVKAVMFQPASEGVAREFTKKYGEKTFKESIFTLTGMLDYHVQNRIGARNVGISANSNSVFSLLTQNKQTITGGVTIDGFKYTRYGKIYEDDVDLDTLKLKRNTRSKFDSMSSVITLFVDNVKLGLAPQVNLTAEMTNFLTHFIALGAGQTRGLMIVNQPVLLSLTKTQSLRPELFDDGKGFTTTTRFVKQMQDRFTKLDISASKLNTKDLDAGLKTNLDFEQIIGKNKSDLTPKEIKFLQSQRAALETFAYIADGPHKFLLAQTLSTQQTTRGFDAVAIADNNRTVRRKNKAGQIQYIRKIDKLRNAMLKAQDAGNTNKVLDHNLNVLRKLDIILTPSIDGMFLSDSIKEQAFIAAYPEAMSRQEIKDLITTIRNLKKNPKYEDNIALNTVLKIRNNKIVADSQLKMSVEVEGQITGQFEDLFLDNPGFADNLLKYLFATTKLKYVNDSFLKFLPSKLFDKYNAKLDEIQKTKVIPEVNAKKYFVDLQEEEEPKEGVAKEIQTYEDAMDVVMDPGLYSVTEILDALDSEYIPDGFKPLFDNLEKEGVKVHYKPGSDSNFYHNKIININKIEGGEYVTGMPESIFVEEAMHAGLDMLDPKEKTKLRKDILQWYEELVKNHADTSPKTQEVFNRYANSENYTREQAAEEIMAHLLHQDGALANELNELVSPNKKGILQSVWSKFVDIIAKYLGIEVKQGSELERLSEILAPSNQLFEDGIDYTRPGYDPNQTKMFNLPPGESSMFEASRIYVNNANNISKLLVGEEFNQIVFDESSLPIVESIVNIFEHRKDHGRAVILDKRSYEDFKTMTKSEQNELAQSLGWKNVEDWTKNANGLEKSFINGTRDTATVLRLKVYSPSKTEDLIQMNSVDKDRNVTNNVLQLLYKQVRAIEGGNIKNTEFVENRKARLNRIIADVKEAQDVFNSIDDFFDDVKTQHELLNTFLDRKNKKTIEQLIDGLTKYRILMEDMSFINELPQAFKDKLKTTKYKSSEKMLKKLQDAVNMIESMRAQLKKEYIPVLAKKLYPMIKRSGPETKKYVDTLLEDINQTISKVQSKVNNGKLSQEEGNKKISRLRGRLTKLRKLAEQAPQSEEEFAKFLMYTTHDMDWMGFMLMAPSSTSDPGLAGLVQYTSALAVEARRQAINVSNQLETAGNLLEEGMKEKGRKISNSPIKYYEDIIELVNNRTTKNKDIWALVTKYNIKMFEEALEQEELKIASSPIKMKELRAQYIKEIKQNIKKKSEELAVLIAEPDFAVGQQNALEAQIDRLKTTLIVGPTEEQLLRRGTRKWRNLNTQPKSADEIRAVILRQSDVKAWARTQMNAAAQLQYGIITQKEFDLLKTIHTSVYGATRGDFDKPRLFGYQVTRPDNKYINKKWDAMYDENNNPKNKIGEAHKMFTDIYRESLSKVYKKQTVDMALPSLRKGFYDRILENKTFEGVKSEARRLFTVDEDDAFVYGYAAMKDQTRNYAPVYFMDDIDANEVNLDVKMGLMTFANAALRTEQNNEALKLAYMLKDVYDADRVLDSGSPDLIGLRQIGIKTAGLKPGQSYVSKRLEKYIEMVLLGKTKNVTYLPGTNLQIDKVIDNLLSYTAITTLGLDFLKGTRNYMTAVWQQGIEAGASRANKGKISLSEFLAAHKVMMDTSNIKGLMEDKYQKLGNKSYLGQLLLYFDAIQGNFDDMAGGKQTTGNTMLRQTIMNPDSLLINYHMGEVAAQGAAAIALLTKKKVTVNGEETSLYSAFRVNKKTGNFEFAGTEAEKKAAQETIRIATEEIKEMNIRLNGNYTSVEKSVLSQTAGGRMLELFRKFLVPTVMNRWRVDYVNHQKGEPDGGFYRRAIGNMWSAWKTSAESDLIKRAKDTKRRSTLTPQDKEALMKALNEVTLLAMLSAAVTLMMGMQDDDDEELSVAGYYLLYLLTTTRAEIMAFAPTPTAAGEFLRILRSPTAMTTSIERTMKLLNQLGAPLEEYQRDSGPWEKGENKLKVRALQWLGISGLQGDPETALRNFLMITER